MKIYFAYLKIHIFVYLVTRN